MILFLPFLFMCFALSSFFLFKLSCAHSLLRNMRGGQGGHEQSKRSLLFSIFLSFPFRSNSNLPSLITYTTTGSTFRLSPVGHTFAQEEKGRRRGERTIFFDFVSPLTFTTLYRFIYSMDYSTNKPKTITRQ